MRAVTASDAPTPFFVQQYPLAETVEPEDGYSALPAVSPDPTAEAETPLLVAALEEIEARRAAIEWLRDADLLCLCLV